MQWIPFSRTYGIQNGYPEGAITGKSSSRQRGAVARAFTDQNLLTGFSTTYVYKAYLFDTNQTAITLTADFDILVVPTRCSIAWVPYRPGEQVEGRSWIYVQHVNLAFLGGRPVNLRATRKFTGQ